MLVAGLYNGNVAVYNLQVKILPMLDAKLFFFLQKNTSKPSYISSAMNGKHQELVWQVIKYNIEIPH